MGQSLSDGFGLMGYRVVSSPTVSHNVQQLASLEASGPDLTVWNEQGGDEGKAVGSQLLGPVILVEARGHQCVLGTEAVFVDSGLVDGENASHHEQGGQGKHHIEGLETSCTAKQEETLPIQLEQLHERNRSWRKGCIMPMWCTWCW